METFSKEWWTTMLELDESKTSTETSPYHQLVLNEMEEIERTSQEFNIPLEDLQYAFEAGQETILNDDIWSILDNTDSYKIKDLEQAIKLAEKYEKDWKSIVDAIKAEQQLPLPMVLNWADNKYYLVAGNTRLMIYRALKLQPVVLMAKMDLKIQEGSAVFDVDTIKLDNKQNTIVKNFIKYAVEVLDLQNVPSNLTLSYNNDEAKERHSFGYFDPNKDKIWLYVKNRNMADILRTLAHELVHRRQAELGLLDDKSGVTGSPIENTANAVAGILLREFGKNNEQIYESLNKVNEWKIIPFSFNDFIKKQYVEILHNLNNNGVDLMEDADIDVNDMSNLSFSETNAALIFGPEEIQDIQEKLSKDVLNRGFNGNFKADSIIECHINAGNPAHCRGILFTLINEDIIQEYMSGVSYGTVPGITYKGLPIYYDFIWC